MWSSGIIWTLTMQQFRITYHSLRAFHKYFNIIVDHILVIIFGTQFESLPWIFVYIHTTIAIGWLAWVNILSPIFEPITRKSVKISKFLSHHAMLLYTAQCTAQYGVELFLKKNSYIPNGRHWNPFLIINRSWILTVHKNKIFWKNLLEN